MSLKTKIAGFTACLAFDNRAQLILNRLFFRKSRFVAHRINKIDFVADQQGGDECGLRPCLTEGMYDPFLRACGANEKSNQLVVADVGSNAGGFSLIFAAKAIPIKKIAAVEMNPLTYSRMRLNLLTTFGPSAKTVNAAIAGQSGTIEVPFTSGGTGESMESFSEVDGPKFSVPLVTLDEFLDNAFPDQKIDILKLDIEGAEWDVLNSNTCKRLADCRFLIVEIHARAGQEITEFAEAIAPFGLMLMREVVNPAASDVFCFRNNSH